MAAMTSQAGLLLRREHAAVPRLPRVVRVAATPEMGQTAVVGEAWDGRRSPTDLQLLNLLNSLNDGEKLPTFVHRDNAYSAAPQDLVRGRRHAPGTGRGVEGSCYFYSEPAPAKAGNRARKVPGGTWHPEGGRKPISAVASKKSFSYLINSPPGMKTHRGRQRTGWIMAEVSLDTQGDGPDHMVLCVVHKSMHKYPDTSMAAGRSVGEDAAPVRDEEASVHDPRGLPGGDISSPPPVPATPKPAPSIPSAATTNLLLQAIEKAASWGFEKACEIQEFVEFKQQHLRIIDFLGLDRSIVSGSLDKLEILLKQIAIKKKLTPDERDDVISCGVDMSTTISMAYFPALRNRLKEEFSALGTIGFTVHHQASDRTSKESEKKGMLIVHQQVKDIFMLVHDSEDKEYKQNLYSASAPLQDGVKRKADDHNHPEAPPSVRQLQRTDTNRRGVVPDRAYISEIEHVLPLDVGGYLQDPMEFSSLQEMEPVLPTDTVLPLDVGGYLQDPMEFGSLQEMDPVLLADTVLPLDVGGYLQDPMEFDAGGVWAASTFGGEAGEHAEMAECSTAPRRVPGEEWTKMNRIAVKTSRLFGVDDIGGCGDPLYRFGVNSALGDDEAPLATASQQQL